MRLRALVIGGLTGLGVVACSENAPPPASNAATSQAPLKSDATTAAPRPAPAPGTATPLASVPREAARAPAVAATPREASRAKPNKPAPVATHDELIPPRDAQWTLFCYTVNSPTHVEDSKALKRALANKTGRRDWYVIHGQDASNLYFGFYRTINEARDADTARAKHDRDIVANVEDSQKNKPFQTCAFVQLNAPDPASRPEWNLAYVDRDKDPKDPTRAFWSLQIMAFLNNPQRKEAAVQAVADLRAQGVDAYYYHGDTISSVCVGAWAPSAVKGQHVSNDDKLGDKGVAHAQNPDATLVVTNEPLMPEMLPKQHDDQGRPVVAVAPKLEIIDEGMKKAVARFTTHAVNYEIGVKKGASGKDILDSSFLVTIPRPKGNGLFDSDPDAVSAMPPAPISRALTDRDAAALDLRSEPAGPPAEAQGPGRLRSINR